MHFWFITITIKILIGLSMYKKIVVIKKYDDSILHYSLSGNFQQCIIVLIVHLYARFLSQSPSGSAQRKSQFWPESSIVVRPAGNKFASVQRIETGSVSSTQFEAAPITRTDYKRFAFFSNACFFLARRRHVDLRVDNFIFFRASFNNLG